MSESIETSARNTSIMSNKNTRSTVIMNATTVQNSRTEGLQFDWLIGADLEGRKASYHIHSFLAQGGEAVLFLCDSDDEKYVAKVYDRVLVMNDEKRQRFIELLYEQKSPYIVPLADYGIYKNLTFDIYPYMENGNLLDCPEEITLEFIKNVVVPDTNEALLIVHSFEVSHRDIKPQNIMISNDKKHIMLNDFSIMSIVESAIGGGITQTGHRTNGYAAPEIITLNPHVKSDYYALGITLLSLINGGKDIFDGMDEETIRKCTMYNDIPYLNPEKFVDASVFSLSLRERIEGLICGLTIHDIKERWGYKEVKEWCEGKKHFPIIRAKANTEEFVEPFIWNGSKCFSPLSMAETLAKDWDNAKREAGRGTFADWLKVRRPDLASKVNDIVENTQWKDDRQANVGFFKMIYTIAPNIPCVYWKGKKYADFNSLAFELAQKGKDEAFQELLKRKVISWFIDNSIMISEPSENVKLNLEHTESIASTNEDKAYYMFLLQFLPNSIERYFLINNKQICDTQYIVDYISQFEGNTGHMIRDQFFNNNSFAAWMWFKGYEPLLEKAIYGIENISNEDCLRRMLILLDTIAENPTEVRELVLKKGEYSHIFWLKSKLDQYEYVSELGRKSRFVIDAELVDTVLTVEELYEVLMKLSGSYGDFARRTCNHPYQIAYGVADEKTAGNIIPKAASTSFVFEKNGVPLTAGYVAELTDREGITRTAGASSATAEKTAGELKNQVDDMLSDEEIRINSMEEKYFSFNLMRILLCVVIAGVSIGFGSALNNSIYQWAGLVSCVFPLVYAVFEIINMNSKHSAEIKMNEIKLFQQELNQWQDDCINLSVRINKYLSNFEQDVDFRAKNKFRMIEFAAKVRLRMENDKVSPEYTLKTLRQVAFVVSGVALGTIVFGYSNTYVLPELVNFVNIHKYIDIARMIMGIAVAAGIGFGFYLSFTNDDIGYERYALLSVLGFAGILAALVAAGLIVAAIYIVSALIVIVLGIGAVILGVYIVCAMLGGS